MIYSTSISTFFHNVKRTFYAMQVIVLMIAVPVLSSIEMSRGTKSTSESKNIETRRIIPSLQKETSLIVIPSATFLSK